MNQTKTCFAHDAASSDSKDFAKISKNVLEKACEISRNPIYDGYKIALINMVYKCFGKKNSIRSKIKCK